MRLIPAMPPSRTLCRGAPRARRVSSEHPPALTLSIAGRVGPAQPGPVMGAQRQPGRVICAAGAARRRQEHRASERASGISSGRAIGQPRPALEQPRCAACAAPRGQHAVHAWCAPHIALHSVRAPARTSAGPPTGMRCPRSSAQPRRRCPAMSTWAGQPNRASQSRKRQLTPAN